MEKYSSGRRGSPAKGVGRGTGARVQIPPSPYEKAAHPKGSGCFFVHRGKDLNPKRRVPAGAEKPSAAGGRYSEVFLAQRSKSREAKASRRFWAPQGGLAEQVQIPPSPLYILQTVFHFGKRFFLCLSGLWGTYFLSKRASIDTNCLEHLEHFYTIPKVNAFSMRSILSFSGERS